MVNLKNPLVDFSSIEISFKVSAKSVLKILYTILTQLTYFLKTRGNLHNFIMRFFFKQAIYRNIDVVKMGN